VLIKEILHRFDYTLINRAQRFHDRTYDLTESTRSQMDDLNRLAKSWPTAEHMAIEKVDIDKFIRSHPFEAKKVSQQS
jgi:hypothetical protein